MSDFNAARNRAKRPCPLWVDAFQRDTQHLEADEVGAYMLILMAMWTRETCDFPDDDRRLAKVSRVSTRLWKSRIGPILREFFTVENGAVISKRLREEAAYVERQVTQQHNRKTGEKSDKPLENKDVAQTADEPRGDPRGHPSYNLQPTEDTGANAPDGDAVEDPRDVLWEKGRDWLKKVTGLSHEKAGSLIGKWLKDRTPEEVLDALRAAREAKTGDPVPYITEALKPKPSPADENIAFLRAAAGE